MHSGGWLNGEWKWAAYKMTTIGLTYPAANLSGNQKNAIVRVISLRNKMKMGYLRMIWIDVEAGREHMQSVREGC